MSKVKGLYLGEILERDGIEYGSNNLIISPTGSGKSYFILNILSKKYTGKKLMLVSTTSLKDSYGNEVGTFTSQDLRRGHLNITDEDMYIMSYAEFGSKIKWETNFIEDYSVIFNDEIHSLLDYYLSHRTHEYGKAIEVLFSKHENIKLFYFTATTHKIDIFIDREYSDLYRNVNIIDYSKNDEIRQYINVAEEKFTSVDGIESVTDKVGKINIADIKGIIFNERIDGMGRIESSLESKGYKSISIWSINNAKNKMTDEQLRVREMLLTTGMLPDEYDFVIMNGAMREGWNLVDERVQVVIANTLDETDIIQFRGRIRHNISLLAYRVNEDIQPLDVRIMDRENSLGVIEGYLGKPLTTEDKNKISEELNVRRESDGLAVKWTTISKTLKANGYKIDNVRERVNGKRVSLSVITKVEDERKSSDFRASRFVAKLGDIKFDEVNGRHLDSYMEQGRGVAFNHIKSSYKKNIINGDWSERKFADVTYLIARDKKLFSKKFYAEYGKTYGKLTQLAILTERAKYEVGADKKLKEDEQAAADKASKDEQEMIAHMKANGM